MTQLLSPNDLFVVQLQPDASDTLLAEHADKIVSVTFETLKGSTVHVAYAGSNDPLTIPDLADSAGIVYPGNGFYYDPDTGRMDVKVDSDLKFVRVIDQYDTVDASGLHPSSTDWTDDTIDGPIARGNFYIVGKPDTILDTNIWHVGAGQDSPSLGDLVICIDDSVSGASGPYDTHEWNVIPNVTGGQAVLQITTSTPSAAQMPGVYPVEVVSAGSTASPQRPRINIRTAGIEPVTNSTKGGILSDSDYRNLIRNPIDVIERDGFITDLTLDGNVETTQAITLTKTNSTTGGPQSPQYKNYEITLSAAEDSVYGVIELASQDVIDTIYDTQQSIAASADEAAMTPMTTHLNFVPRLFNTLPTLENLNTP